MPERFLTFLLTARDQARELRRQIVAALIISRRTQFAVVAGCAVMAGMITLVTLRGAEHARATYSTCPVPATGADGTAATDTAHDTAGDLRGPNSRARVPDGWRIVALPRDIITPDVRGGDQVDLISRSETIATRAVIITPATDSAGLNVAVPPAAAPVVATAAQTGDIAVVSVG